MKSFQKLATAAVAGLSLSFSPLLAGGEGLSVTDDSSSSKGFYVTGSIGGSAIGDIDVTGITSDVEFETGLGVDLGLGYDFGKTRIEGLWNRGQSDKTSWLGYTVKANTQINSFFGSVFYDFREDKVWSPFVGASLGSTSVDFDGASDSAFSYGIGYGLSYKTSDKVDFFVKGQTTVTPELTFATVNNSTVVIENGNYTTGTIGIRVRF